MVITMDIKHVILRGRTYHFRMTVPANCVSIIGKTEIVQSLKTGDPLKAKTAAEELTFRWTKAFDEIRNPPLSKPVARPVKPAAAGSAEDADIFYGKLTDLAEKNLPDILQSETDGELRHRLDFYLSCIAFIRQDSRMQLDLSEIGIHWPMKPAGSPGVDRIRKGVLCRVLKRMCEQVREELDVIPGEEVPLDSASTPPVRPKPGESAPVQEHGIIEVAELMIAAKRVPEKTAIALRADARTLKEWCNGKDDISAYTKRDLVGFAQDALPYLPLHMNKKKEFAGKTASECVALTKADPVSCKPISHRTCENRLANLSCVFNYAKNDLGLITVNPAGRITIPEVRVTEVRARGYSPQELAAMWNALQDLRRECRHSSRYWAPVLSLYHGFRLNEVCSLFIKDVYEDEDGVFVMDINADGPFKSVKNKSSVRIVPVHPFVRDRLDFKGYVELQKNTRTEGILFPDVSGTRKNGYIRRTSRWFAKWKQSWLPEESLHKHFHDLRYTFIRTAQNDAKMSDRCSQEITGHSVSGVSAVHLGYSGRLKPAAVLEELQKIRYGWE